MLVFRPLDKVWGDFDELAGNLRIALACGDGMGTRLFRLTLCFDADTFLGGGSGSLISDDFRRRFRYEKIMDDHVAVEIHMDLMSSSLVICAHFRGSCRKPSMGGVNSCCVHLF